LFYLSIKWRFQDIEFIEGGGATGVDIVGLSDTTLLIQFVIAVVFLLVAVFAWRGRPAFMRYIFMLAVVLFTIVTLATSILGGQNQNEIEAMFDPVAALSDSLVRIRVIFSFL